jgi:hypothetical protein
MAVAKRKESTAPIVTIDSWSGRQTVNIDALLDSDEGRKYLDEMERVPTTTIRDNRHSRVGYAARKKK